MSEGTNGFFDRPVQKREPVTTTFLKIPETGPTSLSFEFKTDVPYVIGRKSTDKDYLEKIRQKNPQAEIVLFDSPQIQEMSRDHLHFHFNGRQQIVIDEIPGANSAYVLFEGVAPDATGKTVEKGTIQELSARQIFPDIGNLAILLPANERKELKMKIIASGSGSTKCSIALVSVSL